MGPKGRHHVVLPLLGATSGVCHGQMAGCGHWGGLCAVGGSPWRLTRHLNPRSQLLDPAGGGQTTLCTSHILHWTTASLLQQHDSHMLSRTLFQLSISTTTICNTLKTTFKHELFGCPLITGLCKRPRWGGMPSLLQG